MTQWHSTLINNSPASDGHNDNLFRLLALGYLALLAATWPLWTPQTVFPQVPLISVAGQIPRSFEWGLLILLLISLGGMLIVANPVHRQRACLLTALSTLGLASIDQHRLQPWAWQFVIVSLVLAFAQAPEARSLWRWLVIGIYAWSAWSKIDQGFCLHHGPFLLDGLYKSIGLAGAPRVWSDEIRHAVAGMIPVFELLIAAGLSWSRTRRMAVVGAAMMHVGLLLALGPFGHNHQPGVLIWNAFFLIQNWILFARTDTIPKQPTDIVSPHAKSVGNRFATSLVVLALAWPLVEPLGLCDHWMAWAVYAAKPERVTVDINRAELSELPDHMRAYLGAPTGLDDWFPMRIDRWSLDALHVPIYPQDRFQIGVGLELIRDLGLKQIRVVIEGPANRWTGKRRVDEYVGQDSVEKLADSFRFNARPR